MNRIITRETRYKKLSDSIILANSVLINPEFYKKIRSIRTFDYSDITGDMLSNLISTSIIIAEVVVKTPINPFTNSTAFTKPKFTNSIFIYNKYIEHSDVELIDITCTLIHEYVHLIDFDTEEYDFGHGTNYSIGKDNTAPYSIDNIVREIII